MALCFWLLNTSRENMEYLVGLCFWLFEACACIASGCGMTKMCCTDFAELHETGCLNCRSYPEELGDFESSFDRFCDDTICCGKHPKLPFAHASEEQPGLMRFLWCRHCWKSAQYAPTRDRDDGDLVLEGGCMQRVYAPFVFIAQQPNYSRKLRDLWIKALGVNLVTDSGVPILLPNWVTSLPSFSKKMHFSLMATR